MPMWRCPHCGAPQPESARCWVCKRSSTSCVTCRHFRRSVAAQVGFCGLDRRRAPLTGEEIRGCWQGLPTETRTIGPAPGVAPAGDRDWPAAYRRLDFVPIGEADRSMARPQTIARDTPPKLPRDPGPSAQPGPAGFRLSLWEDAEV